MPGQVQHKGQLQFCLKMIITALDSASQPDNGYTGRASPSAEERGAISASLLLSNRGAKIKRLSNSTKKRRFSSEQYRWWERSRPEKSLGTWGKFMLCSDVTHTVLISKYLLEHNHWPLCSRVERTRTCFSFENENTFIKFNLIKNNLN